MSVRIKNGRPIVEIYDPKLATKRHVTREEMRTLIRPSNDGAAGAQDRARGAGGA